LLFSSLIVKSISNIKNFIVYSFIFLHLHIFIDVSNYNGSIVNCFLANTVDNGDVMYMAMSNVDSIHSSLYGDSIDEIIENSIASVSLPATMNANRTKQQKNPRTDSDNDELERCVKQPRL
jgi:hypothetical protein